MNKTLLKPDLKAEVKEEQSEKQGNQTDGIPIAKNMPVKRVTRGKKKGKPAEINKKTTNAENTTRPRLRKSLQPNAVRKSTEVDAKPMFPFSRKKSDAEPKILQGSSRVDKDSEIYDMTNPRRGIAIILNHKKFESQPERKGTKQDAAALKDTLKKLDFEVRVYDDKTVKEIYQILESAANEDHSDADCLVVVAMTHGDTDSLYAYENRYPVDVLWNYFVGNKCQSLIGKPKLFFIQACRGRRVEHAAEVIHETDSTSGYTIPVHADLMLAYSTFDGYYSWRNRDNGSWFIQALCMELNEHGQTHDLLKIMTSVARRVAIDCESNTPDNITMHKKKQIPCLVSMLTRSVYFLPKSK